jgi:acyl-coenzyme A synthetase/AMP-(fatty) acid ligase
LKEFPMTTSGKVKKVELKKREREIFGEPE